MGQVLDHRGVDVADDGHHHVVHRPEPAPPEVEQRFGGEGAELLAGGHRAVPGLVEAGCVVDRPRLPAGIRLGQRHPGLGLVEGLVEGGVVHPGLGDEQVQELEQRLGVAATRASAESLLRLADEGPDGGGGLIQEPVEFGFGQVAHPAAQHRPHRRLRQRPVARIELRPAPQRPGPQIDGPLRRVGVGEHHPGPVGELPLEPLPPVQHGQRPGRDRRDRRGGGHQLLRPGLGRRRGLVAGRGRGHRGLELADAGHAEDVGADRDHYGPGPARQPPVVGGQLGGRHLAEGGRGPVVAAAGRVDVGPGEEVGGVALRVLRARGGLGAVELVLQSDGVLLDRPVHVGVGEAVLSRGQQHRQVAGGGGGQIFALPVGAVVAQGPVVGERHQIGPVNLGQLAPVVGLIEAV